MIPPALTQTLPEEELERSLSRNTMAGFFGMLWMTVALGMPLPLLMRAVGASGFQLGLLAGTWQIAMLAQIVSALAVEHLPRRKPYWAAVSLLHRSLWIVPALLPIVLPQRQDLWPWAIIIALALANLLGQAGTAPWQSWMADLLPSERAGRFWGDRHRVLAYGLALGALIYGLILDHETPAAHPFLGFQMVFTIATVCGLADIFIHLTVHEPMPHPLHPSITLIERLKAPLRQKSFVRFTLAMGVWVGAQAMLGYTIGLPGFFSMVYLKEQFGTTYGQAAVVFIASAIGAAIWTPAIGRLLDRWGGRRVMLLLILLGPFTMLPWLALSGGSWHLPLVARPIPQPVVLLSFVALVLGGIYSGSWVSQVRFTQLLTNPSGRTVAMGLHWTIVGLVASFGPLLAGLIKDHFHSPYLNYYQLLILLHVALAWLVALPLVWGIHDPAVETPANRDAEQRV
jgi:MFS family permease